MVVTTINDVRTAVRYAESLPVKERKPAYAKAYVLLKLAEKEALKGAMPLADIHKMRALYVTIAEKV